MYQLLVSTKIYREKFIMEQFIGSDNILALVKSGSFSVKSGSDSFTVRENEGMLFRSDVLYERKVITPVTMYFFRYRSDLPIFKNDHIVFADTARIRSTISLLEKLDIEIFKEDFEYRKHLFDDIVSQYCIENASAANYPPSRDLLIEQAILDITRSCHRKLVLSEVAERAGLSYIQFLRRFKAYTNMSPSHYLSLLRLQKAKALLSDDIMLIKDIAAVCGFENEYYFSNFFKKHTGLSPSSFRISNA